MRNIFYRQFHQYVYDSHNEFNGRFYESSGTLIYEMQKKILDWNVIGQVRFPERQSVQILFCYKYIENLSDESKLYIALNALNSMEGAVARFFYSNNHVYSSVELFPDAEEYDVTIIFQLIKLFWGATTDFLHDCIESAIKADKVKAEQILQDNQKNEESDEWEDDQEYEDYRFSARDLADYYGYQEDSDYSYEQFLDDL